MISSPTNDDDGGDGDDANTIHTNKHSSNDYFPYSSFNIAYISPTDKYTHAQPLLRAPSIFNAAVLGKEIGADSNILEFDIPAALAKYQP